MALKEERSFYLFISPWVIGCVIFTAGPMFTSALLSFMDWDTITAPRWIGLSNYEELLRKDPVFWKSLKVTAVYTCVTVPLHLLSSLMVAILLNQNVKGLGLFRTIFYLPTVLPPVASIMLWIWIFFPDGLLNACATLFGIPPQNWLQDERLALPSIMLMSLWGFGASMLIFLAGLQSIPAHLYEAADIDGAGRWSKFRHITLPMLSPVIFFNVVTGIIGTFQVFTAGYLFTGGGPNNATMFYVLYLYKNAFEYFRMGYACALAWVLFVIIMACTLLVMRSSAKWVYYEGAR
jgi:multiple sugar transport system permease protein